MADNPFAASLVAPSPAATDPAAPSNPFAAAIAPPRAAIHKVETPKAQPRPSPLRQLGDLMEVPFDALGAAYQTASGKPEFDKLGNLLVHGKIHEAAEQYSPFADAQVARYAKNNPDDPVAQTLQKNALARGAGTFVGEMGNPSNLAVGPVVGLAGKGFNAYRAAFPEVDAAATAAEHAAGKATAPIRNALGRASGAVNRGVVRAISGAGYGVGRLVNRYQELGERGGPAYVGAGFKFQAAPLHAAAVGEKKINDIAGHGMTLADKREMMKLSYQNDNGERIYEPSEAPKPELVAKAAAMRAAIRRQDDELEALGIRSKEKGELYDSGIYWPLRKMHDDAPVWNDKDLESAPDDETMRVALEGKGHARGSLYKAGKGNTGRKKYPTILDPDVEARLHPHMDPVFQLAKHYADNEARIATEKELRGLDTLTSVDPKTGAARQTNVVGQGTRDQTARETLDYSIVKPDGSPRIFGVGAEGHKGMEKYIERESRASARDSARLDPELIKFARANGVDPADLGRSKLVDANLSRFKAGLREANVAKNRTGHFLQSFPALRGQAVGRIAASAATPMGKMADTAAAIGSDLRKGVKPLKSALARNSAAAEAARQEAEMSSQAAGMFKGFDDTLSSIYRKMQATPARSAIVGLASQLRDQELEQFNNVAELVSRVKVQPTWVRQGATWKVAGEYANVPRKYLDLSRKPAPGFSPPSVDRAAVPKVGGNADDVASQVNMTEGELLEWLAKNRTAPRATDYFSQAADQLTDQMRRGHAAEAEETLGKLGLSGKPIDEAIASIRKDAAELKSVAAREKASSDKRRFADATLGGPARGAVEAGEKAAGRQSALARSIGSAQKTTADNVTQAAGDTFDHIGARAAGLDDNQIARISKLEDALKTAQSRGLVAKKFQQVAEHYYSRAFEEISTSVRKEAPKAPQGYTRESTLGIGSSTGTEKALDDSFVHFMEASRRISESDKVRAREVWKNFQVLNRLSRMSIVAIPTVHAINNLGMQYLAEAVPRANIIERGKALAQMGKILAGKAEFPEALRQRAFASGAVSESNHSAFSLGSGAHATTDLDERAAMLHEEHPSIPTGVGKLGLQAEGVYGKMNDWLFTKVEQGYGFDLFDRLTRGGMGDQEAALRVRNALGRTDNITESERRYNANRVFYFYPWMKTLIAFWAKKGIMEPQLWNAPVQAIRANNEAQGYDDPSKPFAGTIGKDATGFTRATVPLPQRVVDPISSAARAPYDVLTGNWKGGIEDAKAPYTYVAGHLNPALSTISDGIDAAREGAEKTAPFNVFHWDKNKTDGENRADMIGRAFGKVFSPITHVENIASDPVGGTAAYLTGTSTYSTKSAAGAARERAIRSAVGNYGGANSLNHAIKAASDRGDSAEVQRLTGIRSAAIQRALAPKPPEAPIPAASVSSGNPFDAALK